MGNARQFALEIDREFAAAQDQWRLIIRRVALQALERVVQRTPVDTGRARMNWYVQIGGAGTEVTTEVDPSGSVAISRGSQEIGTYQQRSDFPVITLYNNLPYIGRLEDGYSGQAPTGMIAVTVAELQTQFR